MEPVINIERLTKRFTVSAGYRDLMPFRKRRRVEALRSVSLQVPRGSVFGILGPNGAGKTTLFKILGTLILPTSGKVEVLGMDVAREASKVKRVLTYVVAEERSLYWRISGRQNLEYFATLYGIPRAAARRRIAELLELLDLGDAADRRVMSYSTGMKQKLALARGLLPDPEVLLLDEPTRSLDPMASMSLWRFIREELVAKRGKTVLVATHNMDEARRQCDRVAILHQGEVRACGSVGEITRVLEGAAQYSLTLHGRTNGVRDVLSSVPGVSNVRLDATEHDEQYVYHMAVENPADQVPQLLGRVLTSGAQIVACAPLERSLTSVLEQLIESGKS